MPSDECRSLRFYKRHGEYLAQRQGVGLPTSFEPPDGQKTSPRNSGKAAWLDTRLRRARIMTMLGVSRVELPDRRPHSVSYLRLGKPLHNSSSHSSAPCWPPPVACTASQRGNTSVTSLLKRPNPQYQRRGLNRNSQPLIVTVSRNYSRNLFTRGNSV